MATETKPSARLDSFRMFANAMTGATESVDSYTCTVNDIDITFSLTVRGERVEFYAWDSEGRDYHATARPSWTVAAAMRIAH